MTRSQSLKPWVIFAGCVLVILVLYWAQAVLVPIALAALLTFILTPPVSWLERWLGASLLSSRRSRSCSSFSVSPVGVSRDRWIILADDLPIYRVNILAKIAMSAEQGTERGIVVFVVSGQSVTDCVAWKRSIAAASAPSHRRPRSRAAGIGPTCARRLSLNRAVSR